MCVNEYVSSSNCPLQILLTAAESSRLNLSADAVVAIAPVLDLRSTSRTVSADIAWSESVFDGINKTEYATNSTRVRLEEGIALMSGSQSVAVMAPGAFLRLGSPSTAKIVGDTATDSRLVGGAAVVKMCGGRRPQRPSSLFAPPVAHKPAGQPRRDAETADIVDGNFSTDSCIEVGE